MKTFKDVKVGDIIFLKLYNGEITSNRVVRITDDYFERRFWFKNDSEDYSFKKNLEDYLYKTQDYWFIYSQDINKVFSAGVYSCVEAILNDINNEKF